MYKHIIWDFDGTLFDTYPMIAESFRAALKELGVEDTYENVMKLVKISQPHAMEHYRVNYDLNVSILKEKYDYIRKGKALEVIRPFKDAENVIRDISKRFKKNYLYTNRGISVLEYLKYYKMDSYFEEYLTRENNFPRKPSPDALLYLIEKHHIQKEDAVMIGDRDIDILAAKNAGIKACYFDVNDLFEVNIADHRISRLEELYELLKIERVHR